LSVDLFGSAFFLLTRYEEVVNPERDTLDRFAASSSLAAREGFFDRPVVNDYADVLWWALRRLWPASRRGGRAYRVLLSHDVDDVSTLGRSPYVIVRSIAADILQRREAVVAWSKARAWVATQVTGRMVDGDPYDTFDFIMRTSEAAGLRSAFYFIAGRTHPYDGRYDLEDEWVQRLMRRIHERGHEIGLHPSYNTYRDAQRTAAELRRLRDALRRTGVETEVRGGRQHYLRWRNPETWRNWADAGLQYDSTLTFADQAGFRTGSCYEYPTWDLERGQRLGLVERPLVVMEATLLSYERLRLPVVEARMAALAATCRRYDGDFTLLWHNSFLVGPAKQAAYERVVRAAVGGAA